MEVLDSRRLTGPNLIWDLPSAVLDVRCGEHSPVEVVGAWRTQLERMLEALQWPDPKLGHKLVKEGVCLALAAPIDALYAATDLNDWAAGAAAGVLIGQEEPALQPDCDRLRTTIDEERNAPLLALDAAAAAHGLPFLWDDDEVSVGLGKMSRTWPARELPLITDLSWTSMGSIPVGLVSGTNGKTTSVRLVAAMARAAGHCVGLSSTDWIAVNDEILDRGDYSGPGGARTVLRDRRVSIAVLETARGGLRRRGLAVRRADAILITNIQEDHLGEFAIADLQELADIKWLLTRALGSGGKAILNAEDPRLIERAADADFEIVWYSPDPGNQLIEKRRAAGGAYCTLDGDSLVYGRGHDVEVLSTVREVPITLGGAARHNVANALGAAALALNMGIPPHSVRAGLEQTRPDDNPGRCNIFSIDGAHVLVDFAHNPHGMGALFELAQRYPARRRLMVLGQAGDRSDRAIRDLAHMAWNIGLERVVLKEMAHYARGRAPGEVPGMMHEELLLAGAPESCIEHREEEMDAVKAALEWAEPGDLVILLIHEDLDAALAYLRERAGG